jgi:hypothetical protein
MKRTANPFSFLFLVVLLVGTFSIQAQDKKYEFSFDRTISQSYPASAGDELKIDNQFGNVNIKTWNRNEVKVDISIVVSSTVKEAMEMMKENIDVRHGKNGKEIYFITDMSSKNKKEYKGNQSNEIKINYEVSMPASLALDLTNKFGKSFVPDLTGKVDIQQSFGALTAGKLSQAGKIDVSFSAVTVEGAVNGRFKISFTKELAVLKNLSGDIDVNIQHCKTGGGVVIYADNTSSLTVNAQHSDVAVVLPKDASASFTADTNFGSFENTSSFRFLVDGDEDNDRRGPKFDHNYKSTLGGGKNSIKLKGSFTDFQIAHEAPGPKPKVKAKKYV